MFCLVIPVSKKSLSGERWLWLHSLGQIKKLGTTLCGVFLTLKTE